MSKALTNMEPTGPTQAFLASLALSLLGCSVVPLFRCSVLSMQSTVVCTSDVRYECADTHPKTIFCVNDIYYGPLQGAVYPIHW
jgi:hypothetical protein